MQQLITFKTAKLAKEKGYDFLGEKAYSIDGKKKISTSSSFYSSKHYPINNITNQSDLQIWLRKIHHLHIVISQTNLPNLKENWEWGYNIEKVNDPFKYIAHEWYFNTYEEALEAGILKALKKIRKKTCKKQ